MFDEARALQGTIQMCGITQEEIAKKLNVSQSYVANKLRLLNLSDRMQQKIIAHGLCERLARNLLRLKDEGLQEIALSQMAERHMTVAEGESITVSAEGVILNVDQALTVTLQSDFKFRNGQNVELPFLINGGNIGNNSMILYIEGNGDINNPISKSSEPLCVQAAEEARYSGNYIGTIIFTIAVNPAENN